MSTILQVQGPEGRRTVDVPPRGVVMGRSPKCDILLPSDRISRQHARIFCDPFGRWIIEDLQSRNGTFVNEQPITAHVLLPGETAALGPFQIMLEAKQRAKIAPQPDPHTTTELVAGGEPEHIVRSRSGEEAVLSRARLKTLNAIIDRLAALPGPDRLYLETCRLLARPPGLAALVLRLGEKEGQVEVLASHVGSDQPMPASTQPVNLHLSRRVLETVRAEKTAVMAGGPNLSNRQILLTVQDKERPRTVFCAPIGEADPCLDVLYLDMPTDQAIGDTFEFVQAAVRQVAMARHNLLLAQVRTEHQVIDHQLAMAREIQSRLTPRGRLSLPGLDVAVRYEPAMWVGGDYCDLWTLEDGRLAFAVGDVAGKGLAAAMVMANLHAALRTTLAFCPQSDQAMNHLNLFLGQHLPEQMFITLFLGLFSPQDGTLEYVNAGHPQPMIVGPGQLSALGQPENPPLGIRQAPGAFRSRKDQIRPGTGLVVFTDGVTECTACDGKMFGTEGLEQAIRQIGGASAEDMVQTVSRAAADFRQALPQHDDLTILALVRPEKQ